ncbi:MAG: hypothetical protein U1E76_11030 [Planctomycetota bacterium]
MVNDHRRIDADHHPALISDGTRTIAVDGKAAIARAVLDELLGADHEGQPQRPDRHHGWHRRLQGL